MAKRFIWGLSIFLVLVLLLLIVPGLLNWNQYKSQIASQLGALTGHEYSIDGDVQAALLPVPHAVLGDFSVRAPAQEGGEPLLRMEKASVYLDILPLLHGEIGIKSVKLVKPVVHASIDENGTGSWMTDKLAGSRDDAEQADAEKNANANETGTARRVSLADLSIRGGAVFFEDRRSGKSYAIQNLDLDLKADGLSGPFNARGKVVYNGAPAEIKVTTGRMTTDKTLPVQLELSLPSMAAEISYKGIGSLSPAPSLQGEIDVSAADVNSLISFATNAQGGTPAKADKRPFATKGLLTYGENLFSYKNFTLAYGALSGTGQLSVRNLRGTEPYEIDAALDLPGPADISALVTPGSKAGGDAEKTAQKTAQGKGAAAVDPQAISFNLPKDVRFRLDIQAGSLLYKGTAINDAILNAVRDEGGIKASFSHKTDGKSQSDVKISALFDAEPVSAGNGVRFSNPRATLSGSLYVADPVSVVTGMAPVKIADPLKRILAAPVQIDIGKASAAPGKVSFSDISLNLLDTPLRLSGSYDRASAAGFSLEASGTKVDIDKWERAVNGAAGAKGTTPAPATNPQGGTGALKTVRQNLEKAQLPALPLSLNLYLTDVMYKGQKYDSLFFKGGLAQGRLTVSSAGFKQTGGNDLNVTGTVEDLKGLKGVNVTAGFIASDADSLVQDFAKKSPFASPVGRVEGSLALTGGADLVKTIVNVSARQPKLALDGAVSDPLGTPAIDDLTFRIRNNDYASFFRLFIPGFSGGGAGGDNGLDLYAALSRKDKNYALSDMKGKIGPAAVTGQARVDLGGKKPAVDGAFKLGRVPLDQFLGHGASPSGGAAQKSGAGASSGTSSDAVPGAHAKWSRNAFGMEWMQRFDVNLAVSMATLTYKNWTLDGVDLGTELKDGTLTINRADAQIYGGALKATAKVSAGNARTPLTASADVKLTDTDIGKLATPFAAAAVLKASGPASLNASVSATGISPARLILSLAGTGDIKGGPVVLAGADFGGLSQALQSPVAGLAASSLLGKATSGESTMFEQLSAPFTITQGVVNFSDISLTGPVADIAGAGNVNLPLWSVDLRNTVKIKNPKDAPEVTVTFKGPLDKPARTFGAGALENFLKTKATDKIREKLQDKLLPPAGTGAPAGDGGESSGTGQKSGKEEAIYNVIDGLLKSVR